MITCCKSLPFSSAINVSRRSSSASIPTEARTPLTSSADGEVLPPRVRRRYAARCFMVINLPGVLGGLGSIAQRVIGFAR